MTGKLKRNPIESLLSRSNCAYQQLEVQEYQSGNKGGGRWRTIYKSSLGEIEVDDMTGRIKIQDRNSDLVVKNESVLENLDEGTKTSLQNLGIKTKGFLGFNKRMRVYVRLIAAEEEILVLGRLQKGESAISMSPGLIVPLVISNLSKPEMLKTLFWRSGRPMIFPYLIIDLVFTAFYIYTALR